MAASDYPVAIITGAIEWKIELGILMECLVITVERVELFYSLRSRSEQAIGLGHCFRFGFGVD